MSIDSWFSPDNLSLLQPTKQYSAKNWNIYLTFYIKIQENSKSWLNSYMVWSNSLWCEFIGLLPIKCPVNVPLIDGPDDVSPDDVLLIVLWRLSSWCPDYGTPVDCPVNDPQLNGPVVFP